MRLVGFIIRIYYGARSPEGQLRTVLPESEALRLET